MSEKMMGDAWLWSDLRAQCGDDSDAEKGFYAGWQARASQSVGAPDLSEALALAQTVFARMELAEPKGKKLSEKHVARRLLAELERLAATPTVKTEQVRCDTCHGQGEICVGQQTFGYMSMQPPEPIMEVCPECGGEEAPSLPAAGSAGEEVEVVGYYEPSRNSLFNDTSHPHLFDQLMTVAQHNRIVAAYQEWGDARGRAMIGLEQIKDAEIEQLRAALSAQQSAPERVSVPRDALQWPLEVGVEAQQKAADVGCDREDCLHDGLQAMLAEIASHGRGEA
ncbi:zinc finger-like domain-containing protein [Ectopseudomonas composti]|uniref:zinc finger-like domain-containing protein n=1 Tax=Ectopseudomonas composti TaxID=658457 RepID=UPI000774A8D2|nr:zinc finger-like domain-containing protein [Pseudomonas composti]